MKAKYLKILTTGERIDLSTADYHDDEIVAWKDRNLAVALTTEPYCFTALDEDFAETIPFALLDDSESELYRNDHVTGFWL